MKKLLALILALTLAASLFGCAQTPDEASPSPEPDASPSEPDASPSDSTHTAEPSPAEEPIPVEVGGRLALGEYNGEPIEWRILDIADGKAFVIAENCVAVRNYSDMGSAVTWENCTLRYWLNGEFYAAAFSDSEQRLIVQTAISNPDNALYNIPGGNDTSDKIFVLSIDEANLYFYDGSGAAAFEGKTIWWWLRSPGANTGNAASVDIDGIDRAGGLGVNEFTAGVRPAMWVTL
ncbi:MAG: DUF6273 domain-containing protein [Oscillospiraceae bacterium]|jgi:hypothetical protein|nr:DUF6273 domain-containing protein [Oscillospiraceae bacterium]